MKICCRCKKNKPITEFNFKIKRRNIRQKACRECTRNELRNHYKNNRNYYLNKAKSRNRIVRVRNRKFILNYLSTHACVDCGETDPIVLEFDHTGNKEFDISFLIRDHSIDKLKKEIKKCEIRCSNCHKRKTAREFGWYKTLPL